MKIKSSIKKILSFLVIISLLFTIEKSPAEAAYTFGATVTAETLNVRSGASTAYKVVGKLPKGQSVTVLEQRTGWWKISSGSITGWASSTFLSAVTWKGYVNGTSLNLRSQPSMAGSILGSLPNGTVVVVHGTDAGWYKVTVPSINKTGWVSASFISKTAVAVKSPVYPKTVLRQNAAMRKGPGAGYAILSNEIAGTFYDRLAVKDGWVQVKKSNGATGWISGTLLRDPSTVLKGKTIVLDPGHGGYDSGAAGLLYLEKNLNLRTAMQVAPLLQSAGARVVYTRSTDVFLPLAMRANISNQQMASAFISIHYNASTSKTANGISTYYYSSARESALAGSIQRGLVETTKLKDQGIRYGNFQVLRDSRRPSVLLELGFISNPVEERIIGTSAFQANASRGIYNGIFNYYLNR